MKKADIERKGAKEYSLLVVPSSTLAIELGKIRKRRKDNKEALEKLTRLLNLSVEEIHQMERGNLEGIDYVNDRLKCYFNFLDATMNNLYKKDQCMVSIPDLKGKSLGTKTYLMAIDAYTTKFDSRDELLNDIRKNGYLDISSYTNDELWLFIERPKHDTLDKVDLIYGDNEELINFIKSIDHYGYAFDFTNPYVEKINKEMKAIFRSRPKVGEVDTTFRIFVQKHPELYKRFCSLKNWDQIYGNDIFGENTFLGNSNTYPVVRNYYITYEQYKKEKDDLRKDLIPFNERAEEDYRQDLTSEPIKPKITDSMHIFDTAFRPNTKLEKQSKTDVDPNQLQFDFGEDKGFTR